MKLKHLSRVVFICVIGAGLIFSSHFGIENAHAIGLGGYLTFGKGNSELNSEYDDGSEDEFESNGDAEVRGIGFLLDTAVAKDRVFNYRLQIGFEKTEYDFDELKNTKTNENLTPDLNNFELDIERFVIDNTFGFGIVRKESFRLWIGPQVRIGYMSGDGSITVSGDRTDLDIKGLIFGFAPVIGTNINFKNNFTLGVDLGYRFNGFFGDFEEPDTNDDGTFYGNDDGLFINFAFIYRINDTFKK